LDARGTRYSHTDVLSFPAPTPAKKAALPPTPVKNRPDQNPYNSIRRREIGTPGPPVVERRRPATARTPHPGSGSNDESSDGHNRRGPKSRFHTDFDIIGDIGEGSFETVYKVLSRLDGCMYAIKAAQRKAKGDSDRDRMLKEVCACGYF
jgi:hypothetical protein